MPADTFRSWFLGLFICTVVGACNVLLNLRPESLTIQSTVVQLIAYPYVSNNFPELWIFLLTSRSEWVSVLLEFSPIRNLLLPVKTST